MNPLGSLKKERLLDVRGRHILLMAGLWAMSLEGVSALGFDVYPEDPLKTHDAVSVTPGRAVSQATHDPCQGSGQPPSAWALVDVIEHALCHNPQTREAWANAR
ncbi:MAG: hypothetical protein EBY15_09235, partial [Gammaproteobacteria bacterium]|nr:hypothetical protein [Gammaproteobacteria bacterium]